MRKLGLALAAAFVGLGSAGASAQPAPNPNTHSACFFVNQFWNWKAPNDKTIYIRVNLNQYYRLDLASSCPELLWPDPHLIMNVRGPDTICTALDWQLRVSNGGRLGGGVPCIVKTMTELTPGEAAAIPAKFKP